MLTIFSTELKLLGYFQNDLRFLVIYEITKYSSKSKSEIMKKMKKRHENYGLSGHG